MKQIDARIARQVLDERFHALPSSVAYVSPRSGWVRAIRDALGMSAAELGRRMGVSHSAVFELERTERRGTARLDTLRRAADAMECDLVYALIPRRGLESTVRSRAEEIADGDLRHVVQNMALEDQAEPVSPDLREDLVKTLIDSGDLWSRP